MNALDIAYGLAGVLSYPIWSRKARGGWDQRFGKIEPFAMPPSAPSGVRRPRVLVHAVSVGEVNALRAMVPLLLRDADVIVSATTDTGLARARSLFSDLACVRRYPLDFSHAVRRFLDATQPDVVALCELELWPNFVRACAQRGLPVCVVNGRLSERSFRNYRKARPVLRGMFQSLALACVQDEDYARRFVHMGVPTERVRVSGQMKWDAAPAALRADERSAADELARSLGIDRSRPLIVAGSTGPIDAAKGARAVGHASEESLLDEACGRIAAHGGPEGVQLLCAPRRPERFDEAFSAMGGPSACVRRSTTRDRAHPDSSRAPSVSRFLLDTIGELRLAYAIADVVVIGRSFGALHGSDPIEPAALGKPVLAGPRMGDFRESCAALEQSGALVRTDADSLSRHLAALLSDADQRERMGHAGLSSIQGQRGASAANARAVLGLLDAGRPNSPVRRADREHPARAGTSMGMGSDRME